MSIEVEIRELVESDFPVVDAYIKQEIWKRAKKEWAQFVDPEKVEAVLKNTNQNIHAVIVDETYVLVFRVAHLWFTSNWFIEEMLVVRALPGKASFASVHRALDHICRVSGASGILAGTAMVPRDAAMVRLYKKGGFSVTQIGLFKNAAN